MNRRLIWLVSFLICLHVPGAAAATGGDAEGWQHIALHELGLKSEMKRYRTEPTLDLPFPGRRDQVWTAIKLDLALDVPPGGRLVALEVSMNGEKVAALGSPLREGRWEHSVDIDPKLVGDSNLLELRLVPASAGPCGEVEAGAWGVIASGTLSTMGGQLRLANDLSLLPLPFFDPLFDKAATVPVVLPSQPNPEAIRSAAWIAGWLGLVTDGIEFPVSLGELPASHAVVFIDDVREAARLGLPIPHGPSLQMVDHPGDAALGHKLLVVGGRTPAELQVAARSLALSANPLKGESIRVSGETSPGPDRLPYDAARWARRSRGPQGEGGWLFAEDALPADLVREGTGGGSLSVGFRIPPDVSVWPQEWLELELGYSVQVPEGMKPPRLDVEFNGSYVATLPAVDKASGEGRSRLRVHSASVKGYNELQIHVSWPDEGRFCDELGHGAEVRLLPSSTFGTGEEAHFSRMPDVGSFVHDGFPFTRLADLSETALVLPERPEAGEIGTALSLLAHLASITGEPGSRLSVIGVGDVSPGLDLDLLLVGRAEGHELIRSWSGSFPLRFARGRVETQAPSRGWNVLEALGGWVSRQELKRLAPIVSRAGNPAAVMGIESPLARGRSVVVITAGHAGDLPTAIDLKGFAEARTREGDLLLLGQGKRWSFRVGATYPQGEAGSWLQLRWYMAQNWLALLPLMLLGALATAFPLRGALARKAARRLGEAGEPSR